MVELCSLDDVGQGYDLAQGEPERAWRRRWAGTPTTT